MEFAMTQELRLPDRQTSQRLLANLRQTSLELEEFGLQISEISSVLEAETRQQKLNRVQRSLNTTETSP
jgi:hypothetical protein